MRLDSQAIAMLSEWSDPLGILSVYLDMPYEAANSTPTSPIALRNGLHAIAVNAREKRPHAEWTAIHQRLAELAPDLEALVSPSATGRGRALFARASGGEPVVFGIQLHLPTRVVLGQRACVLPLLTALDEGRTCGLVSVQRDGVQLHEWRLDETEQIDVLPFELTDEEWRERKGPAHPNPARNQQSAPDVGRFERRVDANRYRFLKTVAQQLSELASRRQWQRLAVFGDMRLSRQLLEAMPARNEDLEVVFDERVMDDPARDELRVRAGALMRQAQRQRELSLVTTAKELRHMRGRAALGLRDALDALNGLGG